jgi:transposase-like protein
MKEFKEEILRMRSEGKTQAEIAEHFGLAKIHIKNFFQRHNRNERKREADMQAIIPPKRRGRPPASSRGNPTTEKEKDKEIERLRMENDLLRDFLQLTGRR